MTAKNVTYADLDSLLRRLGFNARPVDVPFLEPPVATNGAEAPRRSSNAELPPRPALIYEDTRGDTMILLPHRPSSDPVQPQHLIPTRRLLLERGLIDEDDFDRWLCQVQFPDDCAVSAGADVLLNRVRAAD